MLPANSRHSPDSATGSGLPSGRPKAGPGGPARWGARHSRRRFPWPAPRCRVTAPCTGCIYAP